MDCVITNPPFGGMEDDTVGSDHPLPTRETADIFMALSNDSQTTYTPRLGKAERAQQGRLKLHHLFLNCSLGDFCQLFSYQLACHPPSVSR